MAGDGGGGGHGRADQVGPAAGALPPLEVAVAGAGRALAGLEAVGVHGQAHAAPRLPPLGAGLDEDAVEPLGLGLIADRLAPRHDQGAHPRGDLAALEDPGGGPQVLDPAVGARADEDDVDGDLGDRRAGHQPHVFEGAAGVVAAGEGDVVGLGNPAGHVDRHRRVGPPGDLGSERRGVDREVAIEGRRVVGPQGLPVGERRLEGLPLGGERAVAAR